MSFRVLSCRRSSLMKRLRRLSPYALWLSSKSRLTAASFDSRLYWEKRYAQGRHSGNGSRGKLAAFKAEVLNRFVRESDIEAVIEYGCGDGNQLSLSAYPRYLGFDVSATAIRACRRAFAQDPTKTFKEMKHYSGESADLTLSLDVIYHLVEDDAYNSYMDRLFSSSKRFSILYSTNCETLGRAEPKHIRHRRFSVWIEEHAKDWQLQVHIPNKYPYKGDHREGSFSDFYIYKLHTNAC